jgi:hypothetical protein
LCLTLNKFDFNSGDVMSVKQSEPVIAQTMLEFQKEFRGKLYAAVATSLVAGLIAAILGIWAYAKTLPGSVGLTPPGAVLAFDRKDGCPTGWQSYPQAWGRFIIGAVEAGDIRKIPGGFIRDARGVDLTPKPFGEPNGEEMHVLTEPEMPVHIHSLKLDSRWGDKTDMKSFGWGGDNGLGAPQLEASTLPAGGSAAHNNMPPYVALYFCRKN